MESGNGYQGSISEMPYPGKTGCKERCIIHGDAQTAL